MPGESSAVPTEDGVWLHYLETSPPAGPESVQHNPQEPVAAVVAQAMRRVLLANRKLVAKREDLRLQGSTGSKTGGY
jgi:NADH:ubiquinone oxidoreductase subunit